MYEKLKAILSDDSVYFALIILLVGAASFGLGRLSPAPAGNMNEGQATVQLTESRQEAAVYYVGSRNGDKYHYPWCPGAVQMKSENQLVFATREAAEAAGYTPAGNCPGLTENQ